jgi:DNA-directed RNA polymerase specialized sigma24 family protein
MLPDRLKPAFLLKFRHQYTYDEIAHSNGTSRYTVWAHLKTAIGILRANRERLEGLLY